jgi:hypothetical protein
MFTGTNPRHVLSTYTSAPTFHSVPQYMSKHSLPYRTQYTSPRPLMISHTHIPHCPLRLFPSSLCAVEVGPPLTLSPPVTFFSPSVMSRSASEVMASLACFCAWAVGPPAHGAVLARQLLLGCCDVGDCARVQHARVVCWLRLLRLASSAAALEVAMHMSALSYLGY